MKQIPCISWWLCSTNILCQLRFITFPVHISTGLADLLREVCFVILCFCEGLGVLLLFLRVFSVCFFVIFSNICCISGQETQYSWDLFMFPFPKNFCTILLLLHTGFLAATSSKSSANHSTCSRAMQILRIFFSFLQYPYLNPLHITFWACVHVVLAKVINLCFDENPSKQLRRSRCTFKSTLTWWASNELKK